MLLKQQKEWVLLRHAEIGLAYHLLEVQTLIVMEENCTETFSKTQQLSHHMIPLLNIILYMYVSTIQSYS